MRIGSIKNTSLLDYPSKIAAIIGTQGCNMCCPWCHNAYLIPYQFTQDIEIIRDEAFFSFLDQRKAFLDGVVITGGEPTIQSDLPEFCNRLKRMGFAVKMDTNGTHSDVLRHLLENELLDYVAMDIKTDLDMYKHLFKKNGDVNEIVESIHLILTANVPYEFRTTCVRPFVSADNIDQIGRLIEGAKSLFLQKCNPVAPHSDRTHYEIVGQNQIIELKQIVERYVLACEIR